MRKNKNIVDSPTRDGKFSLTSLNPIKSVIARGYYTALISVIIVLIASYLTTIPGSRNSLSDQAENNMLDLSQSYIKILEARISAINDTAEYMNTDGDFYSCLIQGGEPSLITANLKSFIKDNPSYLSAAVYDKDGNFVTASDDGYSQDSNPYYVNAALSMKQPMQSDYLKAGDENCIVCAVPLINADTLFGCVAITVPVQNFTAELASVKLQNTESSFAYLLTPLGHFLYHPDSEYIGKITGEEIIRDLISKRNVVSAVVHFNYEGEKIAGLATSTTNGWTLIIQADKSELLKPVNDTVLKSVIVCIIIAALVSIIAYLVIYVFLHPIALMTKEIKNISSLDFTSTKAIDRLTKEKTEIGTMAREIKRMHNNIKNVISNLNEVTENISSESTALRDIATSLTDCASENSAVSEQLASGMEQTTDTVNAIKGQVDTIKSRTVEINKQSQDTIELSDAIMDRATNARQSAIQAANSTRALYSKVSVEAHTALEQSKAVSKINDLTQNILDIAEQTSLLALNANIEAAKSGKYGKGFAVVAKEISNLAEQSSNTVSNIIAIVTEVTTAVNNIDDCLTKTLNFIDASVMKDYDNFTDISNTYHRDAESFQSTLEEITHSLKSLELATNDIAMAISGITVTINESSEGVVTIADKSTEVVNLSDNTYNQVKLNGEMAQTLQGIVDKFKL